MKKLTLIISAILAVVTARTYAEAPAGYYTRCEGLNSAALLSTLCDVVGSHTNVGYDGLWSVYATADVDENGMIWDIYSTKRWPVNSQRCGSYSKVGDCYNREHTVPQSWFNEAAPMKSDAFHVYPTDGKVNGQRSNFPYGECENGSTLASNNGIQALGKLGTSTFEGYSGKVFEPDDEYKGDIARSYFYMAAAYNDKIQSWNSDMMAHNSYPAFTTWTVNLLLKWHRQDPVSQKEIDRNEAIYAIQHNRNPFIDHPELAEYVWGNQKTQQWHESSAPVPSISQPADGTTVDFGTTASGYQVSRYIAVKGANLTSALTISVNSSQFTLGSTSVSASAANSGTGVTVTYRPTSAGTHNAVLTIRNSADGVSSYVNLKGMAVSGIPALAASNITTESFTARWQDLGIEDTYQLAVKKNGVNIAGYPKTVSAALEEYDVTGLEAGTTYTYSLSGVSMTSNVISVTTHSLQPLIEYTTETDLAFTAVPGEPSDAVEMGIYVENIETAMTVSVSEPFELSLDHTNWSPAIIMYPDEDRFYVRVNSANAGEFHSLIRIVVDDYVNDDPNLSASVREASEPWFYEDFETADKNNQTNEWRSYHQQTYDGRVCTWFVDNGGFWTSDSGRNGIYSLRFGRNSSSSFYTVEPKTGGIGTITFYLSKWSSDANLVLDVQYAKAAEARSARYGVSTLADNDLQWTTAATITASETNLTQHSVTVNVPGSNYIRFQQTAGSRGNIDDIKVSDYANTVDATQVSFDNWTAYCLDGELVIENGGSACDFSVFGIDGIVYVSQTVAGAPAVFKLAPGLYIVTDGEAARRVLVK